jgi:hypothetical protein
MRVLLALLLLGAGAFGAACSSNADSTSKTEIPVAGTPGETTVPGTETRLPVPGITFGSALGPGGRLTEGTHCWAGRCVDMAGPITATEPFVIPAGTELDLLFEGIAPSDVQHTWAPVPASPDRQLVSDQFVWMNIAPGDFEPGPVTAPTDPGDYLLLVFAQWDEGGDYSFAGYFDVR